MRGVRLHTLARLAYEGIVEDLNAGGGTATNATPASASQGGCSECSLPDAVTAAQAGDAIIAPQAERMRVPSGGCGSSISGGNEILNYWYKYLMEFLTP